MRTGTALRVLGVLLTPVCLLALLYLGAGGTAASRPGSNPTLSTGGAVRFAAIGDYGSDGQPEADVSALVHSWNPEFVITTGDNNYDVGAASSIDPNIGQYYHDFIFPYFGSYGQGADINRFFPSLGNHDWETPNAQPYLDYFTLPGNERYYTFTWGPVDFFPIDSDSREPDGITQTSAQAQWLQAALGASTSPWKLVYMHHPPYSSSSNHGNTPALQWPYQAWGASLVMAGHDHTYERIIRNGFPYFVNGLGGRSIYNFGTPVQGSVVRYNGNYGAMLVSATTVTMTLQFYSRAGSLIDTYNMNNGPTPTVTSTPTATPTFTPGPNSLLVGHINWQGPPAQPHTRQQLPVTLTVKSGATELNYPAQTTDASGFFTVSVSNLGNGTYDWRAKGSRYLASSGALVLSGNSVTQAEMGLMRTGDADNDNRVNAADFNILRIAYGGTTDPRADFNNDGVVSGADFNFLRGNFGMSGVPPIRPAHP